MSEGERRDPPIGGSYHLIRPNQPLDSLVDVMDMQYFQYFLFLYFLQSLMEFKDFLYVQVSITLHYFLFELGFIHTFYVIFPQYLVSGI